MKYTVSANLCNGSDYVAHWEGGVFGDRQKAVEFYERWWPPRSEVIDAIREVIDESGDDVEDYDLQIGVWDEMGNDIEFYTEGFGEDDLKW